MPAVRKEINQGLDVSYNSPYYFYLHDRGAGSTTPILPSKTLSREAALKLFQYLGEFLSTGQDAVLLIGGPRHGEFVAIQHDQHQIEVPTINGTYLGSYKTHFYREFPETQVNGAKQPLRIFEHESLWKENKKRATKELDEKIAKAQKEHNEQKAAAEEARQLVRSKLEELTKLWDERDELTYKHGI